MSHNVDITLHACDGDTVIHLSDLNDSQLALLEHVASLTVAESEYECMPVMQVRRMTS